MRVFLLLLSMAKSLALSLVSARNSYEYLDSGNFLRLERFGNVIVSRSCPTAKWSKSNSMLAQWNHPHLTYIGQSGKRGVWEGKTDAVQSDWIVHFDQVGSFYLQLSEYGQVGVFPEQESNWRWLGRQLTEASARRSNPINVLNGFAYTGGSTMASLSAGSNIRVRTLSIVFEVLF